MKKNWQTALVLGIVVLGFHLRAVCPTFHWYDSAELVMAATRMGVPHQPGYGLYVVLGKIASLIIPFGELSFRLNLLSTFLSAGCATLTFMAAKTVFRLTTTAAATGVLLLSFTGLFREPSLVAEVYTLEIFLLLAVMVTARKKRVKNIYLAALLSGLLVSLRPNAFLYLAACWVTFGMFTHVRQNRRLLPDLIFIFLLGLSPVIITALRLPAEQILLDPRIPRTVITWLKIVTARDFQPYFLVFTLPEVLSRVKQLFTMIAIDISPAPCLAALVGAVHLYRTRRPLFFFTFCLVSINIGFLANFSTGEIHRMVFPTLLALTFWVAAGVDMGIRIIGDRVGNVLARCMLTGLLAAVVLTLPVIKVTGAGYRNDTSARIYGEASLALAQNSDYLIGDSNVSYRPLLFLREIENRNRTVSQVVVDLFDENVATSIRNLQTAHPARRFFSPLLEPPGIAAGLVKHFRPIRNGPTCWLSPRWQEAPQFPEPSGFTIRASKSLLCPLALTPAVELTAFGWNPGPVKRGRLLTLDYIWTLREHGNESFPAAAVLLFRKTDRTAPERKGILVFHDVHPLGQWLTGYRQEISFEKIFTERSIIQVPYDLEPGTYSITISLARAARDMINDHRSNPIIRGRMWLRTMNPLSYRDRTQIFRLTYGQSGPFPLLEPTPALYKSTDIEWHILGTIEVR